MYEAEGTTRESEGGGAWGAQSKGREVQSDGRSGEEKGLERWGAAVRTNGPMVMFLTLEGLPTGLEGSSPCLLLPGRLRLQGSLILAGPPCFFLQD